MQGTAVRRGGCLLLAFVIAAMASGGNLNVAYAQNQPVVNIPEHGQCPDDETLEAFRRQEAGLYGRARDFPDASFVLDVEQARLKRVPTRASPVIKAEFQPFEKVEIFGYSQESREFVLVRKGGEGNEKRCGWMDTDMLVSWNTGGKIEPLRQSNAPSHADFYIERSPINLKAVVHNLRVAGDVVPVYSKPNLKQGKVIRELKQFEFLDIFKVALVPKSKRKYFFLVGRRAAPGRAPEILGWAHQDHITIWSTRMAAYWTGKGGIAYNRPMRRGQAMEAPKGTPDSGDQVDKKYPVLTTLPEAERLSKIVERMRNPTFDRILPRITDVRLGAPGQACAKDGSDCLSAEQFEKLAQRANENMRRLKTIDIVFLIDGTSGMDPYFKAVARGVANFVGTLDPGDKDARLNVSIALYGDYKGNATGPAAIDYEPIGARFDPLDETGPIDALVARAQKRQTIGNAHEDMLEAPFAAILRVLDDNTRWSRGEAGFRYLVHIADHGNREPGEARASAGGHLLTDGLDETATRADVVEMLRRRGVIYVPLAVPGKYVAAANDRFALQANEILQDLQAEGLAHPLAKIDSSPEEAARRVSGALRDAIKIKQEAFEQLARIRACHKPMDVDTERCIEQLTKGGGFMATIALGAREHLHLSDEEYDNIMKRRQSTLPVWVPPIQDGKQVIDFWLMLEPKRADQLHRVARSLCRTLSSEHGAWRFRKALKRATCIAAGEDDETCRSRSPADTMHRGFYIPAWALADILGKPWDKLESYIERMRPSDARRWNKHFCRKAYLLHKAIYQNRKVDEGLLKARWDDGKKRYIFSVPREAEKKFSWKYDFGYEQVFFFIPFRFIP